VFGWGGLERHQFTARRRRSRVQIRRLCHQLVINDAGGADVAAIQHGNELKTAEDPRQTPED
jgi:hypothetical protein